jgi:acylglycerol lipase
MKQPAIIHEFPVEYRTFFTETMPQVQRYVHRWAPLGVDPSAALVIVHGLGDHGGRFHAMANSLASNGMAVMAIDLVGHGKSPGRRGVVDSFEHLLDEVGNSVYFGSRTWNNSPLFVFGQSMGGNLVLNWAMRRPFEAKSIAGVVAVAPMLRMARSPSRQFLRVGRWLERRLPNLRVTTPVDVRQLCNDPLGQDAYLRDRLVHKKMSLRLGLGLIEGGEWILNHPERLNKPTLLMHGCDDTITCPLATEELATKTNHRSTLRLWPNCRHDLHYELQRESVANYLLTWMKHRARVAQAVQDRQAAA